MRLPEEPEPDVWPEVFSETYADLLRRLRRLRLESAARAGRGKAWTGKFTEERLAFVEAEIEDVGEQVLGPAGEDGSAAKYAEAMYDVGFELAERMLVEQGLPLGPTVWVYDDDHERASRAVAQEITGAFANLNERILRSESALYRDIQTQAALEVGPEGTVRQYFDRLMQRFAEERVGGFEDSRGRQYGVEGYALRIAQRLGMKALRTAMVTEAARRNVDLLLVIGGEWPRTCDTCRAVDGKLVSLSGMAYPELGEFWGPMQDLYEQDPPFGHDGCVHALIPWMPGETELAQVAQEQLIEVRKQAEQIARENGVELRPDLNGGSEKAEVRRQE